jgi:hypothetical protein
MKPSPLPVGETVKPIPEANSPLESHYQGQFVTLSPINPAVDIDELHKYSHGSEQKEQLWTYMGYGPFDDTISMRKWLEQIKASQDPLFLTFRRRK